MEQSNGLRKKLFVLLATVSLIFVVIIGTIFGIFGVSLESINKDTEKVQTKNDVYAHPMFKPIVKKELEVVKSNIKAGNTVLRKVRLIFYAYT